MPVVAMQLKVAVDPSVALTDMGVLTKARIHKEHSKYNYLTYTTFYQSFLFLILSS